MARANRQELERGVLLGGLSKREEESLIRFPWALRIFSMIDSWFLWPHQLAQSIDEPISSFISQFLSNIEVHLQGKPCCSLLHASPKSSLRHANWAGAPAQYPALLRTLIREHPSDLQDFTRLPWTFTCAQQYQWTFTCVQQLQLDSQDFMIIYCRIWSSCCKSSAESKGKHVFVLFSCPSVFPPFTRL